MSSEQVKQQGLNDRRGLIVCTSEFTFKSGEETRAQARRELASPTLDPEIARDPLFDLRRNDDM